MPLSLITHADGAERCSWCGAPEQYADYVAYHDSEWGQPVASDKKLFEKITLEGFQSGLSWLTILRKRAAFRAAFLGFDIEKVARFTDADVQRLVLDAGIVRHRGKIASAINNAQRVCDLIDQTGSLAAYVWRYEPAAASRPAHITPAIASTLTHNAESTALSKDLKKRGFSFVGPTTMYAFMQSMGLVNDHLHGCHAHASVEAARLAFKRP